MSLTQWIFAWTDDGGWRRLAHARFQRWLQGERYPPMEPFGGRGLRVAEILVEMDRRRPVRAVQAWYVRYRVRPDGRVDEKDGLDKMAAAASVWSPADELERERRGHGNVVEASNLFGERRYWAKHRWRPTPGQVDALNEALWRTARRRIGELPRFVREGPRR